MPITSVQYWTRNILYPKIFHAARIKSHLESLVKAANMDPRTFLGVYIASPRQIALRNYPQRHSTDSLAFPYHDHITSELENTNTENVSNSTSITGLPDSDGLPDGLPDDWCLGEIILCPERICKGRRHPLLIRRRLETLLTHGFVHLLGYDHHTVEEWKEMRLIERRLCKIK